jgi:hypothetical protein
LLCPDYVVNPAYYNSIFIGNECTIKTTVTQSINELSGLSSNYFSNDERHFYMPSYYDSVINKTSKSKIITVPEGVKAIGLDDYLFRSRAGYAEESFRYEFIAHEYKNEKMAKNGDKKQKDDDKVSLKKINTDIVRGIYGPYLAFNNPNNTIGAGETVNIYVPDYSPNSTDSYF